MSAITRKLLINYRKLALEIKNDQYPENDGIIYVRLFSSNDDFHAFLDDGNTVKSLHVENLMKTLGKGCKVTFGEICDGWGFKCLKVKEK